MYTVIYRYIAIHGGKMAKIGKPIGKQRLADFRRVREVAEELELNTQTLKRWLKDNRVNEVIWGRDRRNWIYIHRDSVNLIRNYRDAIHIAG
jgi:hypothetical protein